MFSFAADNEGFMSEETENEGGKQQKTKLTSNIKISRSELLSEAIFFRESVMIMTDKPVAEKTEMNLLQQEFLNAVAGQNM